MTRNTKIAAPPRRKAAWRALLAGAAGAVAVLAPPAMPRAHAVLFLDLGFTEVVDGKPAPGGRHKVATLLPGDTLTIGIWAVMGGWNIQQDELLSAAMGNFISTGDYPGDLGAVTPAPIFAGVPGTQGGRVQDLDGDGDLDVGSPLHDPQLGDFFAVRAAEPVPVTNAVTSTWGELFLGHFTFTTPAHRPPTARQTLIDFVPRAGADGTPLADAALWYEDGGFGAGGQPLPMLPFDPTTGSFGRGAPVIVAVIPEPACGAALIAAATSAGAAGAAGAGLAPRRRRRTCN